MALDCPRCFVGLEPMRFRSEDGRTDLHARTCHECNGLWLDGADVARAYTRLGNAVRSGPGSADPPVGRPPTAIPDCPRCHGASVEFPFLDVRLDWCTGCHGVWIDGLELMPIAAQMDRDRTARPKEEHGGYRTAAGRALQSGLVACARCAEVVPLGESLVTSRGTVCSDCGPRVVDRPSLDLADVAALRRAGVEPEATYTGFGATDTARFLRDVLGAFSARLGL